MPGCSGELVVTTSCAFYFLHARLRVHRAPGIPCALYFRGWLLAQLGRFHAARTRGCVSAISSWPSFETRTMCAPQDEVVTCDVNSDLMVRRRTAPSRTTRPGLFENRMRGWRCGRSSVRDGRSFLTAKRVPTLQPSVRSVGPIRQCSVLRRLDRRPSYSWYARG